jgi:putative nucleotidyltransferase with HDIG domain
VARTRASVEEVRQANVELATRNADLQELLELSGGLASRAHDVNALVDYVQDSLGRLTDTRVWVDLSGAASGIDLLAGGSRIGTLVFMPSPEFDRERWERIGDVVLPQLATALESAQLGERVRRVHRDTIASLSRSMEAKDYYTGGHTERVSELSVALARRLGFAGVDLEAIEIGALLHDIGKIGIPERILHKPGPLDADEWQMMKEHPIISDYILSEIDLHPIVRQIVRWSHERIDGAGYPDGLAGDDIPLPARIVLVADALDALTTDRPYRPARHTAAAVAELRAHAGSQFCPRVLEALDYLLRCEPTLFATTSLHVVSGAA